MRQFLVSAALCIGAVALLGSTLTFAFGWRSGQTFAQANETMAQRMVNAGFYPNALGEVREAILLEHLRLLPPVDAGLSITLDPSSTALAQRLAASRSVFARTTLWRWGASMGVAQTLNEDQRFALILEGRHIGAGPGVTGANLFEASLIAFGTLPQQLGSEEFMSLVQATPQRDIETMERPEIFGLDRSARKARRPQGI